MLTFDTDDATVDELRRTKYPVLTHENFKSVNVGSGVHVAGTNKRNKLTFVIFMKLGQTVAVKPTIFEEGDYV